MSKTNESAGAVDVLAVMDGHIRDYYYEGDTESSEDLYKARAAVAELIEAAHRAEVMFNTVRGCYERNPGNFMSAMRELEADVLPLRAALARAGSAP